MKELWELTDKETISGALALKYCPRCGGNGSYEDVVPRFEDGELIEVKQQVSCDCRERVYELFERANLPGGRFRMASLGNFEWEIVQPLQVCYAIKSYVAQFERVIEEGLGLALTGNVGTGKTHVAVGLVKLACGLGIEARYFSTTALLARIKATYNDRSGECEAAILEELVTVPLLALDDLGTEQPSDWVRDRLYTVINERYNELRPTITTSNEGLQDLTRRLGKRIVSRLAGACVELLFLGEDYRAKARARLLEELGLGWPDIWAKA